MKNHKEESNLLLPSDITISVCFHAYEEGCSVMTGAVKTGGLISMNINTHPKREKSMSVNSQADC